MNDSTRHLRWAAWLALAVALSALSACGGSTPEVKHYRLDLKPERVEAAQGDKPVLALEQFTTDAAYDEPQMVYRTSPYELNYYYYHRWAATPGLLLTDALRRGYEATGRFQTVSVGQIGRSDVVLTGHIAAIEEVDVTEEKWIGRIVLELRLRDARTGDLLWSQVIEEEEPLESRSPTALAEAVSAAVTRIVEATADQIVQIARQSGGAMSLLGR